MLLNRTALLVIACSLATGLAASPRAADAPAAAPPPPELTVETFDAASALVGKPLPKGYEGDFPVLKSVFRPWTIAENHVRPVQIKTMHETYKDQYEHVLLQQGKVVAVRLFLLDIEDIKQITPQLEHLYLKDFADELLDDFEPNPKTPATDVFSVDTPDLDKWTARQWSYTARTKNIYTICWEPAGFVQVWIETPKFHAARLAEEARPDASQPVSY
jgi:hypothetical protein